MAVDHLLIIAAVLFISGGVGGIINFFIADPDIEKRLPWWQHAVVGIGASFMVPLFLNMISSNLIDSIRGIDDKTGDFSKLFVLAGFCLVAAVSSRAFIRSLSDKVMQEVRRVDRKADDTQMQVAEVQATVAPFVETETGDDATENLRALSCEKSLKPLTDDEKSILKALSLSPFLMRSLSGLSKQTQLEKPNVNMALSNLIARGYIQQRVGERPRWYVTSAGREFVATDIVDS